MQLRAGRTGARWLQSRSGQQNHAAASAAAFEVRPDMSDILKRALPKSKRSTDTAELAAAGNDIHAQARSWEADNEEALDKSERRAWTVAKCAGALLVMSWAGMLMMQIRHSAPIAPAVMFWNDATGDLQTLDVFNTKKVTVDEMRAKAFAWKYVRAREEYIWPMLQSDYDTVKNMSDQAVFAAYDKQWQGDDSLDKRFGSKMERRIERQSIQIPPDQKNTVFVHYKRTTKHLDTGLEDPPEYFVARLTYGQRPMKGVKESTAIDSPDGTYTASYVSDSELAPARPMTPAAAPAPAPTNN
ncbi:type IV secretion system protein [Burkholderia ambifaria]|uniref:type IV secretion system protein n=1 Tax=Burkholderia ambifaria TaxID=152480 RepID=UPI0015883BDB|nr:type IV secretion system protein [Burkholderia ambifaria]